MRKIFIIDLVIMIMRACMYLLFQLYLRNLLFLWLMMKILLTLFLKYPTIRWKSWLCSWCCYLHLNLYRVLFIILMVEVMTYCALLSPLSPEREGEGSSSSHQIFQRRFNQTSFFRGGLLWKRGWPVVWMDRSETVILSVKKQKKCYFC